MAPGLGPSGADVRTGTCDEAAPHATRPRESRVVTAVELGGLWQNVAMRPKISDAGMDTGSQPVIALRHLRIASLE